MKNPCPLLKYNEIIAEAVGRALAIDNWAVQVITPLVPASVDALKTPLGDPLPVIETGVIPANNVKQYVGEFK